MTHAFNFGVKLAALTQPEASVKLAANPSVIKQMVTSLTRTPAQAGQKAMLAARSNLKIKPGATYPHTDFPIKADRNKFLWNPDQRTESLGWAASGLPGKPTHYSTGPDILPRRDALSSVGHTAARNQALTQAGVLGGAASLGALSTAGQQAPPPEVKARANPPASAPETPAKPTPITPTSLFQRATGIYPK